MFTSILRHLIGTLRVFPADRRGGIQVLFALALVPLLAGVGLAIDAARGYMVKARMSVAVDAAALAGARSLHMDTWESDVQRFFTANFPTGYMGVEMTPLSITANSEEHTVEVVAQASMPTTFMKLLKINDFDVEVRTVVSGERRGLELALVLDVTGSMDGSKITALRDAAIELTNILYGGNETLDNLYISVVPFAGRVNVSPNDDWHTSTPWYYQGCGDPRSGAEATDDSPPSAELWDPFYNTYAWWDPTVGCPDERILPLTAEKSTIQTKLNALTAAGNTRTDIGMVWGWRTISPQWQGEWGATDLPLAYDTPLMDKAVIIMTDGENTPWQSGDSLSVDETNTQLLAECTAMKQEGITIFSITFQAPPSLDPVFSACASSDGNHYSSPTEADLNAAFVAIATQLSNLRIVH